MQTMSKRTRMMLPGVLVTAAMLLTGCPNGGDSHLTVPVPPSVLSRPSSVDVIGDKAEVNLGFIEPRSRHRITFVLHNRSARTLTIRDIKTECSCTAVSRSETIIRSGKTSRVDITYTARSSAGQDTTKAVVLTDDPDRLLIPLVIKADTGLALAFRPRSLDVGEVPVGRQVQAGVLLANLGREPIQILDIQTVGAGIGVDAGKARIGGGRGLPVTVFVNGGKTAGTWTASLDIFTDSAAQPVVSLPIHYTVTDGLP